MVTSVFLSWSSAKTPVTAVRSTAAQGNANLDNIEDLIEFLPSSRAFISRKGAKDSNVFCSCPRMNTSRKLTAFIAESADNPAQSLLCRMNDGRRSHRRPPAQACARKQATQQEDLAHRGIEQGIPIAAISKGVSHQLKEPKDPDVRQLAQTGNSEHRRKDNHRDAPLGRTEASDYPTAGRQGGAVKPQTDGRKPACAQCSPHPNQKQARDEHENP